MPIKGKIKQTSHTHYKNYKTPTTNYRTDRAVHPKPLQIHNHVCRNLAVQRWAQNPLYLLIFGYLVTTSNPPSEKTGRFRIIQGL